MSKSIAIYGSHDASICIAPKEGIYRVYEFERLLQERYCKINENPNFKEHIKTIFNEVKKEYNIDKFEKCYFGQLDKTKLTELHEVFGCTEFIECPHHPSHAACAFYQSGFEQAIIISHDGGGWDLQKMATFKIFRMSRNKLEELANFSGDFVNAYTLMAAPISEIKKSTDKWGLNYLAFAGKLMGLAAYGNVRSEWVRPISVFYRIQRFDGTMWQLDNLLNKLKLPIGANSISGQTAYDLAATAQFVFEQLTLKKIMPIITKYNLPICMTGGAALNVLLNQTLKDILTVPLFIPPNPNDCGLSFGQLTLHEPPLVKVNLTYNGFNILDKDDLPKYIKEYNAKIATINDIAKLIIDGKIIGLIQGNSEVGPRALGNRSIICDPSYKDMKNILNNKVKFREWFRPFAPVVRAEEVNKFFHFKGESEFMSFAPKVKDNYIEQLASITHIDKTARVQTITEEQNKYLYDLIGEIDKLKGIGVVLNTSFNIKGKPILTKISEALHVLDTTELDCVLFENYLFTKKPV